MIARLGQKGVTLLELVLLLVVIAGLTLVTVRYFIMTQTQAKVTQGVNQINIVANASYKWMKQQRGNFCGPAGSIPPSCSNGITVDKLVQQQLVTDKDIKNPWDNSRNILLNPYTSDPTKIIIGYDGIPGGACYILIAQLQSQSSVSNYPRCSGSDAAGWKFEAVY